MATIIEQPKTSGGVLDLDPAVADAFQAHIELLCTPSDDAAFEAARERRDSAVRSLDDKQRGNILLICNAMTRLAQA